MSNRQGYQYREDEYRQPNLYPSGAPFDQTVEWAQRSAETSSNWFAVSVAMFLAICGAVLGSVSLGYGVGSTNLGNFLSWRVDNIAQTLALCCSANLNSTATRIVYVNKNGNDTLGVGTESLPYLTIEAAVNSITGASATWNYVVVVGPGTFDESGNFTLKPWVSIVGASPYATFITTVGDLINLDPSFKTQTANSVIELQGFSLTDATRLSLDFLSIGGNFTTKVILDNIRTTTGSLYFSSRYSVYSTNSYDALAVYNCKFASASLFSGNFDLFSNVVVGNLTLGTTTLATQFFGNLQGNVLGGVVATTQNSSNAGNLFLQANSITGDSIFNGNFTLNSDASSLAGTAATSNIVLQVAAESSFLDNSLYNAYTPDVPANWNNSPLTVPTTVKQALDTLQDNLQYQELNVATNATGPWGAGVAQAVTLTCVRNGRLATCGITTASAAGSVAVVATIVSTLTTPYRPSASTAVAVVVQDNTTQVIGKVSVSTGGVITVGNAAGTFAGAGTTGWSQKISFSYNLL